MGKVQSTLQYTFHFTTCNPSALLVKINSIPSELSTAQGVTGTDVLLPLLTPFSFIPITKQIINFKIRAHTQRACWPTKEIERIDCLTTCVPASVYLAPGREIWATGMADMPAGPRPSPIAGGHAACDSRPGVGGAVATVSA